MGRTCIADHRPEYSIDTEKPWHNHCAQCELEEVQKQNEHLVILLTRIRNHLDLDRLRFHDLIVQIDKELS